MHSVTVSAADVAAGVQRAYNIRGASDHGHTLALTAAHFATLRTGNRSKSPPAAAAMINVVTVSCA
jgi:hypothetical protein